MLNPVIRLEVGEWLKDHFQAVWIGVDLHAGTDDTQRLNSLRQGAKQMRVPRTASGGAVMHCAGGKPLHDALPAIRLIKAVSECGYELLQNGERPLPSTAELQCVYPPDLLAQTLAITARCTFSLDELRYEYLRDTCSRGSHTHNMVANFDGSAGQGTVAGWCFR